MTLIHPITSPLMSSYKLWLLRVPSTKSNYIIWLSTRLVSYLVESKAHLNLTSDIKRSGHGFLALRISSFIVPQSLMSRPNWVWMKLIHALRFNYEIQTNRWKRIIKSWMRSLIIKLAEVWYQINVSLKLRKMVSKLMERKVRWICLLELFVGWLVNLHSTGY